MDAFSVNGELGHVFSGDDRRNLRKSSLALGDSDMRTHLMSGI